jgi:hypothetical protein
MQFERIRQDGVPVGRRPEKPSAEIVPSHFEKDKRPDYRYYYHATFLPLFDKIEESGVFKFKEYVPNLTLSPDYSFKFIESEVDKGPEQIKHRAKHLPQDEKEEFASDGLGNDDGVMLVIEPVDKYKVHSTSEGQPNVFSTPDQMPDDVSKVVRTRIWRSYQYTMAEEPIQKISPAGIKHPGMRLNRRISPDGVWEKIPVEQRIDIPGELPSSAIKMAIRKNPEFLSIFAELKARLDAGGPIDLSPYKQKLSAYFSSGRNIIKDEITDKSELVENMVTSELEHYLVTAVRNLYLDVRRYKGKKVLHGKDAKEETGPVKSKEQLLEKIRRLNSIKPENEVFDRYIRMATEGIEKEL